MNLFMKVTAFLNGLLFVRFVVSKFMAWPVSVEAFIEMAQPIGVDPTVFRLTTGVIILSACLAYFTIFYLLMTGKVKENTKTLIYSVFFNCYGIGVMIGALSAEFLLRDHAKVPLVIIALFILITSAINVLYLRKFDISKSLKLFSTSAK